MFFSVVISRQFSFNLKNFIAFLAKNIIFFKNLYYRLTIEVYNLEESSFGNDEEVRISQACDDNV